MAQAPATHGGVGPAVAVVLPKGFEPAGFRRAGGDVHESGIRGMVVAAEKILRRGGDHVAGGHENVGVPAEVISISGATSVGGISGFGPPAYYTADEYQDTYQILDNLTKIASNHSVKVGVAFESIRFSTLAPPYSRGSYGFSGPYSSDPGVSFTGFGVAEFITNQTNSASISNLSTVSNNRWYRAAYAQDDWRGPRESLIQAGRSACD